MAASRLPRGRGGKHEDRRLQAGQVCHLKESLIQIGSGARPSAVAKEGEGQPVRRAILGR